MIRIQYRVSLGSMWTFADGGVALDMVIRERLALGVQPEQLGIEISSPQGTKPSEVPQAADSPKL